jgi:UDP-2,4-diacetamido-2,4,6-trideoxy-beta-L-altropyranose hydrolase
MTRNSRQPQRIAFRADASVRIGTGHVMRCLALADALRKRGARCLFLCRPHDGHLLALIAARGHDAIALPSRPSGATPDPDLPAHAHWLGTDWATDAQDSRAVLGGECVDWLAVDHYALDRRWEQAMRPACRRLLVVDDLADRPHDCNLLLDQNLGRRAGDYRGLLPPDTQTLIGPRYALLRPEFAVARAESLARRRHPRFKNLLITMGGIDKDDASGAVLDALDDCDLPSDLRVTVVLGPHAPSLERVQARGATMSRPTRVLVGVSDMARLMTDADLAIGAAGSSSWERCCLGLPTIQLVLAEKQKEVAANLAEAGAAIQIPADMDLRKALPRLLGELTAARLRLLSVRSAEICNGQGAMILAARLQRPPLATETKG